MNKANFRFEKLTVLNLCHCICGGDWFQAGFIKTCHNGINGKRPVWICDYCGTLYERTTELYPVVIEEKLTEINLEE